MLKDEILWEVHFLHKHFNINVFLLADVDL